MVLKRKRDPTAAIAWCLIIILLPLLGTILYLTFGQNFIHRPIRRKAQRMEWFERRLRISQWPADEPDDWEGLIELSRRVAAYSVSGGNRVELFTGGELAYESMIEAIARAKRHIHLEYFVFQPDATGKRFIDALIQKAREGVEVRVLYDALGSYRFGRISRPLIEAGGKCVPFLPLSPFRRWVRLNLRNHRKLQITDGEVGFIGGLNIGDEYLGNSERFGPWRDAHLRIEGPAVVSLQRVFARDWHFSCGESLVDPSFFTFGRDDGDTHLQIIESGPEQEINAIREVYFAAIVRARKRLWITTPYLVPDSGFLSALRTAAYSHVDVRILMQSSPPDKWLPYFAARYYWGDLLDAGVRIFQYEPGMLHAKVILADSRWASVGTANLDERSLGLNFEVNCVIHSPAIIQQLERDFLSDLRNSAELTRAGIANGTASGRVLENVCRLLSPIL